MLGRCSWVLFLCIITSCKPRTSADLLGNVPLSGQVPPKILYHYGQYQFLGPYGDRNQTFSTGEWNGFPSASQYLPYRRGIYAGQHPAYNERYGIEHLGQEKPNSPWLMRVHLADACMKPERIAGDVLQIHTDSRFVEYIKGIKSYRDIPTFQKYCSQPSHFAFEAKDSGCTQLVELFYKHENIGITVDHLWPGEGFWVIRDPSCVERIETSPQTVLTTLGDVPELLREAPYTSNKARSAGSKGRPTEAIFHIFARAVVDLGGLDPATVTKWRKTTAESDYPHTSQAINAILDAATRCNDSRHQQGSLLEALRGYLAKAESPNFLIARGGAFTYESYLKTVSSTVAGTCGGTPVAAAPPAAQSNQPLAKAKRIFQYSCNFQDCDKEIERVNSVLAQMNPTISKTNTGIQTVYIERTGFSLFSNPTNSYVEIPFGANADTIAANFKVRLEAFTTNKTFITNNKGLELKCDGTGCDEFLNRIRRIFNADSAFTARALKINTIYAESTTNIYNPTFIDFAKNLSDDSMKTYLKIRLDYLDAQAAFQKAFSGITPSCTKGEGECTPYLYALSRFIRAHPQYTKNSLGVSSLYIESATNIFEETFIDIRLGETDDRLKTQFDRRILWLAEKKAYRTKFSNLAAHCSLDAAACRQTINNLYTYAAREDAYTAKQLQISSLYIERQWNPFEPTFVDVQLSSTPEAMHTYFGARITYLDKVKRFNQAFPRVQITCNHGSDRCKRATVALYDAVLSSQNFTASKLNVQTFYFETSWGFDNPTFIDLHVDGTVAQYQDALNQRLAKVASGFK